MTSKATVLTRLKLDGFDASQETKRDSEALRHDKPNCRVAGAVRRPV